jgi:hypothetical protein
MADDLTPDLRRFLSAVHRRAVLTHATEWVGIGLLGGAAAGLAVVATLWWHGTPSVGLALVAIVVGGLLGLVRGLVRRPSVLDVAMLVDRQAGLDDLLGTAVVTAAARPLDRRPYDAPESTDSGAADPWSAVVAAAADAACRRLSPTVVTLRRLDARRWGGVGLSVAITLTLAGLASPPTAAAPSGADGPAGPAASADGRPPRPLARPLVVLAADAKLRKGGSPGPAEKNTEKNPPGGTPDADQQAALDKAPPATQAAASPAAGAEPKDAAAGDPAGGGAGFAESNPIPASVPESTPNTGPVAQADQNRPTGASTAVRPTTAGGPADAAAANDRTPEDGRATTASGGRSAAAGAATAGRPAVPPWQGGSWDHDVRVAREQLDGGRVPPAYRDLVRQYFDDR